MQRNNKKGKCHICVKMGALTYEHAHRECEFVKPPQKYLDSKIGQCRIKLGDLKKLIKNKNNIQ